MLTKCAKAYSSSCSQTVSLSPAISSRLIWGTTLWCPCAQVSLNLENRDLDSWNLSSMLKISYTACPCLSQLVSAQFALEMRLAARNCQKSIKTPILVFKVIPGHWIRWQSRASVWLPISD